MEFDETIGSYRANKNVDDVDDEPLRKTWKNMLVEAINSKEMKIMCK